MAREISLSGVERFFDDDEIIVSKTNLKGHITYANRVFMKLADCSERELLGEPHAIIRHPAMPRCIFKLLWDTIQGGNEIFAYVLNRSKNGDEYWVFAHVTPSFDGSGNISGYHSSRRVPERRILNETIIPLYKSLLEEEERHQSRKDGKALARDVFKGPPGISVSLCSGVSRKAASKRDRATGVREFITKPVDSRKLGRKIRYVLDKQVTERMKNNVAHTAH